MRVFQRLCSPFIGSGQIRNSTTNAIEFTASQIIAMSNVVNSKDVQKKTWERPRLTNKHSATHYAEQELSACVCDEIMEQ